MPPPHLCAKYVVQGSIFPTPAACGPCPCGAGGWEDGEEKRVSLWWETVNKLPEFHRDTYSDRSGSSSPDSEITELKFPSINHD